MTKLEGKAAFITAASRGIGGAVARALTEEGVQLGLASRSGEDLDLGDALGLTCDVRELTDVEEAVAATVEQFGRLDIAVANAGVGSYHPFLKTPLEHVEEMIDVNLKGTIYAARATLPHLIREARANSSPSPPRQAGGDFPERPSTAHPSSARLASRGHSITSSVNTAFAVPASVPAVSPPTSHLPTTTGVHRRHWQA
jgi:NAD(P)-dependent dehydrogenase (short-subunit alcohol dehydrogenase family)